MYECVDQRDLNFCFYSRMEYDRLVSDASVGCPSLIKLLYAIKCAYACVCVLVTFGGIFYFFAVLSYFHWDFVQLSLI